MSVMVKDVTLTLGGTSIQKYIDPDPDISWMEKDQLSDYQNNRFCFVGIKVTVWVYSTIGNLSAEVVASLWGIDDYGTKDSDEYHDTIITDLKSEIRNELKTVYGFSDEDINLSLNHATKYPGDLSW